MNSATSNLIIGFMQDLLVTGGSIITGAMLATETVTIPPWPVIVLAVLTGAIQAARRAQSKVDPSVVQRAVRTPEPVTAAPVVPPKPKTREETINEIVARVTEAIKMIPPAPPKGESSP